MRVKVLGAFGSEGPGQRPSAFLVDDTVLIDAGTVGGALTVPEQVAVTQAIISHSHLDHLAGLCYLIDTLAMVAPGRRGRGIAIVQQARRPQRASSRL